MRTPAILLTLLVMAVAGEAVAAEADVAIQRNYAVNVAGYSFGFVDGQADYWTPSARPYHEVRLGPLGRYEVGFTAAQGVAGCWIAICMLIVLLATLNVRRQRKASSGGLPPGHSLPS